MDPAPIIEGTPVGTPAPSPSVAPATVPAPAPTVPAPLSEVELQRLLKESREIRVKRAQALVEAALKETRVALKIAIQPVDRNPFRPTLEGIHVFEALD